MVQTNEYPFVKEVIADASGAVTEVVLGFDDYQRLLEEIEDRGLALEMKRVEHEVPLTRADALAKLDNEW
ncbi:MAG: hypothetical protein ACFCU8_01325 [Thermosynechococcaceae cyanobacterium]